MLKIRQIRNRIADLSDSSFSTTPSSNADGGAVICLASERLPLTRDVTVMNVGDI